MRKFDVFFQSGEAEACALVCAEDMRGAREAAWQRALTGGVAWEGIPTGPARLVSVLDLGEDDG